MKKPDARRLGEKSLQSLRSQAYRLRLDGRIWAEIASIVGVSLSAMMGSMRRYRLGSDDFSEENVVSLRRGRVQGANLMLQRPARRAWEQDQTALKTWANETDPEIVRRAKAQGGTVYWADETAIRQDTAWIRGCALSGQTPQLLHSARWDSITMISAVTNQGLVRFRLHDGAINTERFIDFLQGLLDDTQNKVFLIVDNLRVHHAKQVRQWVDERKDQIELHYLPPYSPEANPDEWLNRDLKTELRLRPAALDKTGLKRMAEDFRRQLSSTPGRVARYFNLVSIRYVA